MKGGMNEIKEYFLSLKKNKIPVTVLTGFLGSGKTTLLNYILSANHGKRIAVIENEFGEVGVDDQLVNKKIYGTESIVEMVNGCICCTVRGDLIKTLKELIYKLEKFDYILIDHRIGGPCASSSDVLHRPSHPRVVQVGHDYHSSRC